MRKIFMTLQAIAIGTGLLMVALAPTSAAAQQVSKEVGLPLKAAQQAIGRKRLDEAMVELKKADAQPKKSPYEQYAINELKAYLYSQQNKLDETARLYEASLGSGQLSPAKVDERLKVLTQLYARMRNDPKTIEFGNRWIKGSGASDPAAYQLIAQAYYQQKNYRTAIQIMQSGIDAARRAGKPVQENWLQLILSSAFYLKNDAVVAATQEQLVRNFPKPDYWKPLLDSVERQTRDDRARLGIYRLMFELNTLSKPDDYTELAQMNMENGLPGEAVQVMERSLANKTLDAATKKRLESVAELARKRSAEQKQTLGRFEFAAQAATAGDGDVQLGAVFLSYGQYDKAVEAVQRGLKKGAKNVDDAQLLLGRAYLKLGKKEEARKAFKAVPAQSPLAKVADLWTVRSQQA